MFFSHDTLTVLLASRHKLYVQLGFIDKYVADVEDGAPPDGAATMNGLIEDLEGQIGDINRRIAGFRGPIVGDAMLGADPA
jgi:hypothetical protein